MNFHYSDARLLPLLITICRECYSFQHLQFVDTEQNRTDCRGDDPINEFVEMRPDREVKVVGIS